MKKTSKKKVENCTEETEHLFRNIFHPNKDERMNFAEIRSHPVFKGQEFIKGQTSSKIIYK